MSIENSEGLRPGHWISHPVGTPAPRCLSH